VVTNALPPGIVDAIADAARLKTRLIDRVAYASDASHFLLTPRAVVVAVDTDEVGRILRAAVADGMPVTFRSGGTSLSGQASGEGLMIDVRQRFRDIDVLDGGLRVRVGSGATVRQVNAHLAPYGRRLGPDPASEAACTIGGVIANNSSGMACGTEQNTYRTLESAVLVLASGTVIDTADPDAEARLLAHEPDLVDGLLRLKRRVAGDAESVAVIRRHFGLKNTMGYGVNTFLDFSSLVDLLLHLVVGSEGTLAFVAQATFRTVPVAPEVVTALAVFPSLRAATTALPELTATGAATLELMDATSLRVGQRLPGAPAEILGFDVGEQAALLVEYHAADRDELTALSMEGSRVLAMAELQSPAALTSDAAARKAAWSFRKGLYTSVAGARESGTTALLEDVAVPVPALADACGELQTLFQRYGYSDSVVFGHAKDGNIHFMLTDRFEGGEAIGRYLDFTEGMVDLVLAAGGNLKAEHGTGRAMAPYVRRQYGDELYDVMCELKRLFDPHGILNPGVIIDDDPDAHIRSIKLAPSIEEEVDRCVECGYCEPVCPSRDLTLTPRQRIVVRREIARADARGDDAAVTELERDYDYAGKQTCAVDGMCQTACPVLINTGALVKRLRREEANPVLAAGWKAAASGWGAATRTGALALTAARFVPASIVTAATDAGRAVLGADTVPRYQPELPSGGAGRRRMAGLLGGGDGAALAVYVPACVNSMFGPADGGVGVAEAFRRLLERAGVRVVVPDGIESMCCGTPWSSKGFGGGYDVMSRRVIEQVREATIGGALPVISDAASCSEGFDRMLRAEGFTVEDAVAFVRRELLPRLTVTAPIPSLVLHPTCSSRQMGLDADLVTVAEAAAVRVDEPTDWGCCGYAGDRGMLHPELTEAATAAEAAEVATLDAAAHASCNRTCELGMTRATGEDYRHVLEVLEQATRPV
jgi:D-lactate dehydrogenase